MVSVAIVGLGKMGLSHFSLINAHPGVEIVGVCDSSGYILDVLSKYTGVTTYTDFVNLLEYAKPEAVVIATPSKFHAIMVRECLQRNIHVFCEKPFCLDPVDSHALADLARDRGLVTQVGYHNRHIATFREVKSIVDSGALGKVTHVLAEAYGPVVLRPKGSSWRSKRDEGGGALYDYAAHPADLLTWYFGRPQSVSGTVLGHVFSVEAEDEVYSTIRWPSGVSGQLSTNWSDESQRKMTTRVSIWGTNGHVFADRQELRVYLREAEFAPEGYGRGWTVRYTTDLTDPVYFYVRGEEYSAQLHAWVERIAEGAITGSADFADASVTDELLSAILRSGDGSVRALSMLDERMDQPLSRSGVWSGLRTLRRYIGRAMTRKS